VSPFYFLVLGSLALSALASLWRGGQWERATAAVLVIAWIGTAFAPFDFVHPPWIAIAIDTAVFLFLLYAAVFSGRRWTLAAAAFQFLILATHFVFVQDESLEQWAYVSAYYVWNLAVILSLAGGVVWRFRDGPSRRRPQDRTLRSHRNQPRP